MSSKIVVDNTTGEITADGQPLGGASALADLTDVALASPVAGHVLKFNGSEWVNDVESGGGGAGSTGPTGPTGATGPAGATGPTGSATTVEGITVVASALTGTVAIDTATNQVHYYTVNSSANWTPNIRSTGSVSLDSAMSVGQSMTVTIMAAQGSAGYYASSLQIDGVSVTPKWAGGLSPSFGNEYGTDVYSYTIIKTASATWTVLASFSTFA